MADVHLPSTLTPLFVALPRRVEIGGATVAEALAGLEERWPGLRDRLCDPAAGLRPHIHVYVDGERAALETPIAASARLDVIAAISGG
jgi:molybdopterin synthase sulfur carrier subunit